MKSNPNATAEKTGPEDAVGPLLQLVRDLAQEAHAGAKIRTITLDSLIDKDLGIDSLGRAELLARLEQHFHVHLPDEVVLEANSVRDLLDGLRRHKSGAEVQFISTGDRVEALEPTEAPDQAATLVEALEWHAGHQPNRTHITLYKEGGGTETLTYGQLLAEAQALAGGLNSYNLRPGETVALMLPTCRDYFTAFFGILLAGAIPVPLFPPQRAQGLEEHARRQSGILRNSGSHVLISGEEVVPFGKLLKSLSPDIAGVVTAGALRQKGRAPPVVKLKGEDTALLQYTSGSTGAPKGVILSHRNVLANIRALAAATKTQSTDVCVSWLPLYHDMGLIGAWLGSLYTGMRLVILPPSLFLLRPQRWLRTMQQERGTVSAAPNFAYELCASKISDKDLTGLDLSSWRLAMNGSEPVSAGTLERFCRRFESYGFHREAFVPVYGLAECALGLTVPPLGRPAVVDQIKRAEFYGQGRALAAGPGDDSVSFVSCGYSLPGFEVRIIDEFGHEAPEREVGRLQFRGPSSTSGYYRNPDATRHLFQGDWLDSGDFAYIAAGEVYLTGRAKDVIIKGGRNIHPLELEQVVEQVPGVRLGGVAVIGSPDPKSGTERLVVVAETRLREPEQRAEIQRNIQEVTVRILDMPPDEVALVPPHSVPKTPTGKIRRNTCRQLYESGRIGSTARFPRLQRLSLTLASLPPLAFRLGRWAANYLYAGYVWLLFLLLFFIFSLVVMAGAPLQSIRGAAIQRISRLFFRLIGIRITIKGLDHLPSETCVVAVNHASYMDVLVLSALLPPHFRFIAKKEFSKHWLLGPLLRRLGTLFVERFDPKASVHDTDAVLEAVRAGTSIVVFPEGTFYRQTGLQPFRLGAFWVAAQAGVPLVPVAIRGSRLILRDEDWIPRRGTLQVIIAPPLLARGESWSAAQDLCTQTRREILRHCGEPDLIQNQPMFEARIP